MSDTENWQGKRVLITGGLGFIGSNLAHALCAAGAVVTIYDYLDPKSGGNMYNLEGIADRVKIIFNDLRNFEGVCASVVNQDIVFNCAAYTSHPNSMREPLIDIDVNCKGVINLLEAARRFNPKVKIVHIGTSTQIGRMVGPIADEQHPEFPVDIYSANKSASEKYVLIYGWAYKMRTTVVRLTNTFGPRSNIRTPDFGFMNYFIGLALQGKTITVYGNGEQRRSVIYIDDAISALLYAGANEASNGEVFFVAMDEQYDVATIANAITESMGGNATYIEWPKDREVIEIGDAVISNQKAKNVLRWMPQYSLPQGLTKTREYFVQQLTHYV